MRRSRVINRHDVKRVDGHSQLIFPDHHHHLGGQRNEVPMRHREAPPIRPAKRKRGKAIVEALLDLIDHHAKLLAPRSSGKFNEMRQSSESRPIQSSVSGAASWPISLLRSLRIFRRANYSDAAPLALQGGRPRLPVRAASSRALVFDCLVLPET